MSYSKKSNHIEEGLAKLISQFNKKPKIRALATSYIRQFQELEDAFSDLLTETTIDNSEGIHLDNIGAIVGEPRIGRSDEQYRVALRARILLNKSNGTIEDVIALAIASTGLALTIEITEYFPASFNARIVETIDPSVVDTDAMVAIISSGKPGGVGGHLEFFEGTGIPFQFDGPAGSGFDEGEYGGGA